MLTQIGVRVSDELRAELEQLAQADKRKLSDFVRILLLEALQARKAVKQ